MPRDYNDRSNHERRDERRINASDEIAAYYDGKRRDAEALLAQIRQAEEQGAPRCEIAALERRLEAARYTGD